MKTLAGCVMAVAAAIGFYGLARGSVEWVGAALIVLVIGDYLKWL